jgi:hypothetical protein
MSQKPQQDNMQYGFSKSSSSDVEEDDRNNNYNNEEMSHLDLEDVPHSQKKDNGHAHDPHGVISIFLLIYYHRKALFLSGSNNCSNESSPVDLRLGGARVQSAEARVDNRDGGVHWRDPVHLLPVRAPRGPLPDEKVTGDDEGGGGDGDGGSGDDEIN